jgi:hypothetical protein
MLAAHTEALGLRLDHYGDRRLARTSPLHTRADCTARPDTDTIAAWPQATNPTHSNVVSFAARYWLVLHALEGRLLVAAMGGRTRGPIVRRSKGTCAALYLIGLNAVVEP